MKTLAELRAEQAKLAEEIKAAEAAEALRTTRALNYFVEALHKMLSAAPAGYLDLLPEMLSINLKTREVKSYARKGPAPDNGKTADALTQAATKKPEVKEEDA